MAGKRGNGEGSISQRADGRWMGRATINGKRHGVYAKTRKEAADKLRALMADADKGVLPPAERLTLGQHVERWLTDVVKHSVRPRTFESYSELMRLYVLPALGGHKLSALQPGHVQKLYGDLLDRGLSASTVRRVHAGLHRSLEQAVNWNLVPRNVAHIAQPPRAKRNEIAALTPEQTRELLGAAKGTRWEALIVLAVSTGLRQGELLGLKWVDVDFNTGALHVRRQLGRDGQLSEPKTAKGRRKVGLPASAVAALKDQKRRQAETRLLMGPQWEHNDLVFATHAGRPLGCRNVVREFHLLLEKAGLPSVPFHALRHTAASLLLSQGVHPKVVQERLGHSNIAMTLDIYSHLIPSLDRDAADKLEVLFA